MLTKTDRIAITIAIIFVLTFFVARLAYAAATPVATATQVDDLTFIFDASSSPCKWSYCTFEWRYYGTGINRLGYTLGFGPTVVYTFPNAGSYQVMVKESERCAPLSKTYCPGTAQVNVTTGG